MLKVGSGQTECIVRGDHKDGRSGAGVRKSGVSSVVKSVKKGTDVWETEPPVEGATRHTESVVEAQSTDDGSQSSGDGIMIQTSVRNVVSRGWYFHSR